MLLLLLGALAIFAALALAARALIAPKKVSRLVPANPVPERTLATDVAAFAGRVSSFADRTLERTGRRDTMADAIEQADLSMTPGQVASAVAGAAFGGLVIGSVLLHPAVGILLALGAVAAGVVTVTRKRDARRAEFADQLPDVLQVLAGNLRVGHGLLQALESAGREVDGPAGAELRRATGEVRLGRDLVDTLTETAQRVASADFEWVVQAISINREVGGDLAEVLDAVADTIRARAHLARQVQALSAEGRMSAYVLVALPLGVAAWMTVSNRPYVATLVTTGAGLLLTAVAAVLMTAGCLWLRRLVRPVF
ncbi:MAG TPA: type II secretion system F family protein [Acidimicrobiales bacterium]|nr:type II secretion system F family protein [Acidimicrobiales bacterium]